MQKGSDVPGNFGVFRSLTTSDTSETAKSNVFDVLGVPHEIYMLDIWQLR